ncbi:MAG TPA: hypothetical protein VGI29_07960 [Candidatus Binataceae bacterium]|jgi:hypothetical protein
MKVTASNRESRNASRIARGQAMTEFVFVAFVAFIILFVAIQMAAIGREYMALGQLNYQVTRWVTSPNNNNLKDAKGNAVNSPQCADVATLISGNSVAPYASVSGIASGYMGKIGYHNTSCGNPPSGGIGVAMNCVAAGGTTATPCAAQRASGTGVQITLTMDTSAILFLTTSKSNPNFLGIPFPKTLSSEQTMLTQ